jgi:hypothetical protein
MCGPTFHRRDTQVAVTCSGIRVQDKRQASIGIHADMVCIAST